MSDVEFFMRDLEARQSQTGEKYMVEMSPELRRQLDDLAAIIGPTPPANDRNDSLQLSLAAFTQRNTPAKP